ncbi:hypothetical protein [Streptomyces johnsoniae]|uniref:Uncharacterized protein n=1 Tax=Streptomyces johnsoniae TaxID=3075532 RepID=A0ABU2S6D5_9ACTN|nr:hypothetical protein [Streptomyces sp. DSM 41886]MDT0444536.1 hypothetical protein [Streptomyces sp. DSM 41886]
MNDTARATWVTYIRDERVELPATIDGIRAALPGDAERAAFDMEVSRTPGQDLHRVLARWSLATRPDAAEANDEIVERLRAGDFSGLVFPYEVAEDTDEDTDEDREADKKEEEGAG